MGERVIHGKTINKEIMRLRERDREGGKVIKKKEQWTKEKKQK